MSLPNQSAVGVDGRSGDAQLDIDLVPPQDYEDIPIALVEDMMSEVDRRARKIGIVGALVAGLVAVFFFVLSLDAMLVVVVAVTIGWLVGHAYSRYDGWRLESQRAG